MVRAPAHLVLALAALCLGCAGAPVRRGGGRRQGEVVHDRFASAALGVDKDLTVWLPRRYRTNEARYPVIVLLHGVGGDETDWLRLGLAQRADALDLEAIVAMPDGDDGYWADWVGALPYDECLAAAPPWRRPGPGEPAGEDLRRLCVRRQRYEDYVVHDLLGHLDATYRTRPARAARGIGGLSMGGLGALALAMRHRDLFSAAVSHSGAVSLLYAGPHPFVRGQARRIQAPSAWGHGREERVAGMGDWVRRIYGPDLARWRAHDPASLAESLPDGSLALSFDAGGADWLGYDDEARHLDEVLTRAGVRHEMHIVPGGEHDDRYFASRVTDALGFFAAHLGGPRPQR